MTEEKKDKAQNEEARTENLSPEAKKQEQNAENQQEPTKEIKEDAPPEIRTEDLIQAEKPKDFSPEQPKETPTDWATPSDDFDWSDKNKTDDQYSNEEIDKLQDVYSDTLSTISENEIIDGTVVSVGAREVVVNIGYKSEAVVSAGEFRYNPELKPGDKVEVMVESLEDPTGQLILSHRKARSLRSWERINTAYNNNEIIKGHIKCRTKGGMIVDAFGIEAFLPGSQIDVKPIRDYDQYVGKNMEFKVVKINQEYKNVVVSHKALIEAELEEQKKEIIAKLEKGQVLEGSVKNITSYGVFIDLGGIDGLIHITDLSWGRVQHPEEVVSLDEKIQVVILDFDDDKKRIALGLKQLTPHPWDSLDPNMKVGDKVKGKVVVMADYGAFVEIAPGVEGLIHVSEMSWSQHLRSAQEFMNVGDEVEAVILTLDREDRKMSLGIKQLYPDPWEDIEEKYPPKSKHKAKVRNFTNFGVFVELEEGVDGLIHISDLSWTKKIKHPAEFTNIGEDIEVVVLEVDKENRRLSLGHKQLEENPWEVFETIFNPGSIHEGTIIELTNKGAVISLPYGVEGFATPKHLVKEDGTKVKADEKLQFKVIEFNKDAKKIFVSHSRIHEDEKKAQKDTERRSKKKASQADSGKAKKIREKADKTTFGDVSHLAELKEQLEESEKAKKEKDIKEAKAKLDAKEAKKEEISTKKDAVKTEDEKLAEKDKAEKAMTTKSTAKKETSEVKSEKTGEDKKTTKKSDDKNKVKEDNEEEEKSGAKKKTTKKASSKTKESDDKNKVKEDNEEEEKSGAKKKTTKKASAKTKESDDKNKVKEDKEEEEKSGTKKETTKKASAKEAKGSDDKNKVKEKNEDEKPKAKTKTTKKSSAETKKSKDKDALKDKKGEEDKPKAKTKTTKKTPSKAKKSEDKKDSE
jgi:small subunit ribosomal protein S1